MNELVKIQDIKTIIETATNRYIAENPRPDISPKDRAFIAWYRASLLEIGNQVKDIGIRSLEDLDLIFRQVYLPYAIKNGIQPTIIDFSLFTGINADLLSSLGSKPNTNAFNIYNSWLSIIKEFVIGNLSTEIGSNINLIFIAKSVYGLTDSPKNEPIMPKQTTKKDRQSIIAELSGNVEKEDIQDIDQNTQK